MTKAYDLQKQQNHHKLKKTFYIVQATKIIAENFKIIENIYWIIT